MMNPTFWLSSSGALLLLFVYFLVSTKRLTQADRATHLLNIAGSLLLGVDAITHHAWVLTAFNVAWSGIGLYEILKLCRTSAKIA